MTSINLQCNYTTLITQLDKCEFVKEFCEPGKYFNLYTFHYCDLGSRLYFTLPIFILLMLLCFYLLSDTANKYLSSSLTIISDKLGLSQNIAAMTLLAFGNGAPDVISSIVATLADDSNEDDNDSDGLNIAIGALLGAGMVLTTLVFSLVIFFSKEEIKVIPKMFLRECYFYLFALVLLILLAIDGKIYIWEAIIFFSIYFFNLGTALFIEKLRKQQQQLNSQDSNLTQNSSEPSEDELKEKISTQFGWTEVTLEVGLGTFASLEQKNFETGTLHSERYQVDTATYEQIKTAEHVTAVGTTSLRTLETIFSESGELTGSTDIFIRPGYEFKRVDSLITNFHLPSTSLLLLVEAFVGSREIIEKIYAHAISQKYRFYSFGDAMLII